MRFNLICYRKVTAIVCVAIQHPVTRGFVSCTFVHRVNKAFKKDSQRLAFQARMLRFTASRCSPLNAALGHDGIT